VMPHGFERSPLRRLPLALMIAVGILLRLRCAPPSGVGGLGRLVFLGPRTRAAGRSGPGGWRGL